MSTIAINSVVKSTTDKAPVEGLHRILHVDRSRNIVILIRLQPPFLQPQSVSLDAVTKALEDKDLVETEFHLPAEMLVNEEALPEDRKAFRDRRWNRLKELLAPDNRIALLYPESRGPLVSNYEKKSGMAAPNIYRDLIRFWIYGCTKDAFRRLNPRPPTEKDNKQENKKNAGKVRGPSRKRLKGESVVMVRPYQIKEADKKNFEKAYEDYVKNKGSS